MKLHFGSLLLLNKSPQAGLWALSILSALLGGILLLFSLALFGLDLYFRLSGASRLVSAEAADMLDIARLLFLFLPLTGIAFIAIASGIRECGVKAAK
jgi:hypothetical protein